MKLHFVTLPTEKKIKKIWISHLIQLCLLKIITNMDQENLLKDAINPWTSALWIFLTLGFVVLTAAVYFETEEPFALRKSSSVRVIEGLGPDADQENLILEKNKQGFKTPRGQIQVKRDHLVFLGVVWIGHGGGRYYTSSNPNLTLIFE